MNEGLERLKALGAQKVHEDTHISRKNIEGIFNGSYEGMNKVQFNGFLSILEREYSIDLSALRESFMAYWDAKHPADEMAVPEHIPSSEPSEKKGGRKAVLLLALLLTGVLFYMLQDRTDIPKPEELPALQPEMVEAEQNQSLMASEPQLPEAMPETAVAKTLRIVPKAKLWIGFVDLETFDKEQTLTTESIALDTNRSWLMIFGHGHFKVEHGDEVLDFTNDNRVRYIYENGEFKEITRAEFKARNRGQNW